MIVSRPVRRCRMCGSTRMEMVFSLGEQLITCFPKPEDNHDIPKAPLVVMFCHSCLLPQLSHTVNPRVLYGEYWYRSGVNATMRAALKDIVDEALKRVDLEERDAVLDIGSSDGTLLAAYPDRILMRCGFEPSNIADLAQPWMLIQRDFFDAFKYRHKLPKIITSVAMFYDVGDPLRFLDDVALLLHKDGVYVNQMNYLPAIFENTAYDFISHEHCTAWTLDTLQDAYALCGLEIFDVAFNQLNGGSFRVYAQHAGGSRAITPAVPEALAREQERQDNSPEAWRKFGERVSRINEQLQELVSKQFADGKRVVVRGASTRGNVILQAAGLDRWIDIAGDRDERKWGRMMGGSRVKIVPEKDLDTLAHDFELVFIYSYLEELMGRSQPFLQRGGRFIIPVPQVKIVP